MKQMFVVLLLLLAGCASLPEQVSPPRVTVVDVTVKELGGLEQQYNLRLRIHNPNPFDLPLKGASFQAELNGMPLGQGLGNSPVTVPSLGTALLDVEAHCSVMDLFQQVTSWRSGPPKSIRYWVKGKLYTQDGHGLPFESTSELKLPGE